MVDSKYSSGKAALLDTALMFVAVISICFAFWMIR